MKVKIGTYELFVDKLLQENLEKLLKKIKKDWDFVFCVDGREGSGKSVFTFQLAFYLTNGKFSLNDIAYTPEEFMEKVIHAEPYSAIVYDEAMTGLMGRSAMGTVNKMLVKMMAEIRQKNLFVFIVLPSIFDLDRTIAMWRTSGVFHIYTDENLNRGYWAYWNYNDKKKLIVEGKKYYSYRKPFPTFHGRFTNFYPFDKEEYKKIKKAALDRRLDDAKKGKNEMMSHFFTEFINALHQEEGISLKRISELTQKTSYPLKPDAISKRILRWLGTTRTEDHFNISAKGGENYHHISQDVVPKKDITPKM